MRVVVCGGGVVGACIAFFLAQRQAEVVVVERTGVACAASGKSGGFLALDWCRGTALDRLARRSFELHADLAARLGQDWGYRRLDTLAVAAGDRERRRPATGPSSLAWLSAEAQVRGQLGDRRTTAQVTPGAFTRGMLDAALAHGARLLSGRVTGIEGSPEGSTASGVRLDDGGTIVADAVVIAMGPWSAEACRWLTLPPVFGLKGNSITFRTGEQVSPHALFVDYRTGDGALHTPELFPRPDGTTYLCGLSSEVPLPADPAEVRPDAGAADVLRRMAGRLSPVLKEAEIIAVQACFRPVTEDGLPFLGAIPGLRGAFVATGHGVWGILNAPASGEAIAELILDGHSGLDLSAFDPARRP